MPKPSPTKRGRKLGRPWMVSRRHGDIAERRYCNQYLWSEHHESMEPMSLSKGVEIMILFLNGFDATVYVAVKNSGKVSVAEFERTWNDWLQAVHGCKILEVVL